MLSEASTPTPHTSVNDRISAHRHFAFGSVSLDEVKEIKSKLGVTVNDVVMALCAGALRRYLKEHKELPVDPLIAMVPVSAINDGVGLNMTVQSYDGSLDFGLVGCRELVADIWDLRDYLRDELRVLKEAAKECGED